MTTVSNVSNDNTTTGTVFIESTVTGDGSSSNSIKTDGTFVVGDASHHGKFSVDNAGITTDGSGNLKTNSISVNQGKTLHVEGSFKLTTSGNYKNSGQIASFAYATITTTAGTHSYNHNFTGTPAFVCLESSTEAPNYSVQSINSTQVSINFTNGGQTYQMITIGVQ
jgi:hypothetical protein